MRIVIGRGNARKVYDLPNGTVFTRELASRLAHHRAASTRDT